jgi:D-alanyl-D-alanine carboxypeptidase
MNIVTDRLQTADDFLKSLYPDGGPGVAVLVQKDGQVLLRKGYGMANIELGVPIEADMVFRIGSITKQFTSAAVFMLIEQGKLNLDDPIEKFLPDYPTHGHTITVQHLLNHTSGIKSYTAMPEFWKDQAKAFSLTELVDFFKNQPMDFAPGTRWSYNNSGYVLLGAIIEKAAGVEYGAFLQKNIFEPLDMANTYFDNPTRIIPRRVSGYSKEPGGLVNAAYISMFSPHAAGALASTVDDLARWNAALDAYVLLRPETLQRAWLPCTLADGSSITYACGWAVGEWAGWQWVEHGGGINGFSCHALRIAAEDVFVVVLTNSDSPNRFPDEVAVRLAGYATGKPFPDPVIVPLSAEQLARCAGNFQKTGPEQWKATVNEGHLRVEFSPEFIVDFDSLGPLEFVSRRNIFSRLSFFEDESGQVKTAAFSSRYEKPDVYNRIESSDTEESCK